MTFLVLGGALTCFRFTVFYTIILIKVFLIGGFNLRRLIYEGALLARFLVYFSLGGGGLFFLVKGGVIFGKFRGGFISLWGLVFFLFFFFSRKLFELLLLSLGGIEKASVLFLSFLKFFLTRLKFERGLGSLLKFPSFKRSFLKFSLGMGGFFI